MRRFYLRKPPAESEPYEKRLFWVCCMCHEPCGEHPRAQVGANVSGQTVTCFKCWKEGHAMTGADLKCPKCGGGAADVAPDYQIDWKSSLMALSWTCGNGHRWVSGTGRVVNGLVHFDVQHMAVGGPSADCD